MYSQSVLSYDLRHYLAIIASSRHKCFYLISQQEKEFEQRNGNKEWLKGIENTPKKLQDLYEINKILAHQPWLINHEHIAVSFLFFFLLSFIVNYLFIFFY